MLAKIYRFVATRYDLGRECSINALRKAHNARWHGDAGSGWGRGDIGPVAVDLGRKRRRWHLGAARTSNKDKGRENALYLLMGITHLCLRASPTT